MRASSDLPVVLGNVRNPSAAAITLSPSARLTVLVNAAPQWFGLRGPEGLAVSDISVRVGERGEDFARALSSTRVAIAPLGLPLPAGSRDTAETYLSWATTLSGATKLRSSDLAKRLGLAPFLNKPLRTVPPHVRRAVIVATAALTDAPILVLEDPLDALPADVAEEFTRVLVAALAERRVLWLAPRLDGDTELAAACDEALWFHGSACTFRGKAASASGASGAADAYVVSLHGPSLAFSERLTADGVAVNMLSTADAESTCSVRTRETWRIFSAAADVGAAITSLRADTTPSADI